MSIKESVKKTYWVYHSKDFAYLRFILLGAPLLGFWEAAHMNLIWMYFFCGLLIIIQFYVFSIINSKLIVDSLGIIVRKPFQKAERTLWSEIHHIGVYNTVHLGGSSSTNIYYFSKAHVYTYHLEKSRVLPRLKKDFIFVLNQPEIKESVLYFMPQHMQGIVTW